MLLPLLATWLVLGASPEAADGGVALDGGGRSTLDAGGAVRLDGGESGDDDAGELDAGPLPAEEPDVVEADEVPPPPPPRAPRPRPATRVDAGVDAGAPDGGAEDAGLPGAGEDEVPARVHEVMLGDATVFVVRAPLGTTSAERRARDASRRLRELQFEVKPEDVRVEPQGMLSVVYLGATPLIQLGPEDATRAGDASVAVHADAVAAAVRAALKTEQQRSQVATTIFNVSLAVLFVVLAVFLLRRSQALATRADRWLESHADSIPSLTVRSVEVLNRGAVRGLLALAVGVGRWVARVGIVYVWLIATLSLFEATRAFTERLTSLLLEPLGAMTARVASSLPVVVIVLFAALALAILLRAISLFFAGVGEGTTDVSWLPADLAAPTSALVRLGVVVAGLVLVAPVLTGDDDGALARSGLVLLAALGLAATPLLATGVVGVVYVFGRRLREGDWVDLGSRRGRVVELGLLETTLETPDAVEVRVPHLSLLLQPVQVHGPAQRVSVELTVERRLLTAALRERLLATAAALGEGPELALTRVELDVVVLRLSTSAFDADAAGRLLWRAWEDVESARAGGAAP